MKKLKSLLLVAVTLLALSACNNEIDPVIDNTGDDITGYLTLNISSPEIRSARTAPGTGGTEDGDDLKNENTIEKVTIVLTDVNGKLKADAIDATTGFASGKTVAFKVPVGSHYVYALVNSPIATSSLVTNADINALIIDGYSASEATKGFKDGKFFYGKCKA